MSRKRVAIMVGEETRDWMLEECRRLVAAHESGLIHCPEYKPDTINPRSPRVSLESLILRMLEDRQRHRERQRKARRAKQGERE